MRKVDKINLFMKNKRQIDWNKSIEKEIPFEYDEIHGILILKEYYPEDYSIKVEYNNEHFILNIGDVSRGRLGKVFVK